MFEVVEIATTARLVRELVFELPDEFGMKPEYLALEEVWDDEADELDEDATVERMPDGAWGFFTQDRFDARVEHDDEEHQLTSMPLGRSGTTFVGGHLVTREEVLRQVKEQQDYIKRRKGMSRAVGKLPHGKDRRPILMALDRGAEVLLTSNGHYRDFDRARGDRLIRPDDPA